MTALEERLGHSFRNRALLETAVTHSSYANENRASGIVCNERLEILGDSVLGVTVADFLYRHFPDMPEGRMTRLRAELVCEQSLHRVALELHLGDYLRLGKGEEHNGGRGARRSFPTLWRRSLPLCISTPAWKQRRILSIAACWTMSNHRNAVLHRL